MPLYEYRCRGCDAVVEILVRSGDRPACPECQSGELTKLLSGFAVGVSAPKQHACGCGGPDDCLGNRAAAERARGKASCC